MKEKIDFNKAEEVLFYNYEWDYCVIVDGEEKWLSEIFEENQEDDFPYMIKQVEEHGYKIIGARYKTENKLWQFEWEDDNSGVIYLVSDTGLDIKDCITLINIVQPHLTTGATEFDLAYTWTEKEKEESDWYKWRGESTTFGEWWDAFVEFFNEHKKETKCVSLHIDDATFLINFFNYN